jgi:hypothetical protein
MPSPAADGTPLEVAFVLPLKAPDPLQLFVHGVSDARDPSGAINERDREEGSGKQCLFLKAQKRFLLR